MNRRLLKITGLASVLFCFSLCLASAAEQKPVRITSADVQKAIALKEREDALDLREKELQGKEQVLADVQKEVDRKLAQLLDLQKEVQGYVEEFKAAQSTEFKKMVKIYSALSASKVVALFDKMQEDEIVRIMRAMKFEKIIKIKPKLTHEKAVVISKRLAKKEKKVSQ